MTIGPKNRYWLSPFHYAGTAWLLRGSQYIHVDRWDYTSELTGPFGQWITSYHYFHDPNAVPDGSCNTTFPPQNLYPSSCETRGLCPTNAKHSLHFDNKYSCCKKVLNDGQRWPADDDVADGKPMRFMIWHRPSSEPMTSHVTIYDYFCMVPTLKDIDQRYIFYIPHPCYPSHPIVPDVHTVVLPLLNIHKQDS
jgi:hypothetical protein